MKTIRTEITIHAPVEKVWDVLMNFGGYENWNPFIRIIGKPMKGQKLENIIFMKGGKTQKFTPTILEVSRHKSFRWEGHLYVKGLFDGEHCFELESIDEQATKFKHYEHFRGVMAGPVLKLIGKDTKKGFESMNMALKKYCESSKK
ncbi:MAG: SRPBCC domain-containing protein [Bacteroidota bacterium]